MLKRIVATAVVCLALCGNALAGWAPFQAASVSSGSPFSTSIPAGNFLQATNTNASIVANSDGMTNGVTCTNSCYSNMYTLVSFPSNDTCTFSVQAFQTVNPGILDQNAVSVAVDGLSIPAVGVADRNLWAVSVLNSSPAQSYNFSSPVLGGIHQITLSMGLPQNTALQSSSNLQGFHIDRINISCAGTGIPTEPSPQTRDPFNYPYSSYDFWNSAIGSGIVWSIPDQTISSGTYNTSTGVITLTLSGSPPTAFTVGQYAGLHGLTGTGTNLAILNGAWAISSASGASLVLAGPTGEGTVTITGGKAADADQMTLVNNINGTAIGFGINSGSWSIPIYQSVTGTDPTGFYLVPSTTAGWMNGQEPFYLAINSGVTTAPPSCASGGDCSIALAETGNHRYFYMGSNNGFVWGNAQQTNVTTNAGGLIDTFRLYPAISESAQIGGLIRSQDILDGVIAHTLVGGNTYIMQSTGNVNAPGGNGSTATGNGWPVIGYDYTCFNGGPPTSCSGYIQPGELFGIPASVNCSALGLSAGGLMLCHALQDYGAISDVQTGSPTGPQTQLYAEEALSGNATLTAMTSDYGNILGPLLQIARNNTSANFYAGSPTYAKGGGTPRQPIRAGLNLAAYPSVLTSTTASGLAIQPAGFPNAFVAGDYDPMFPYQNVPINFNFPIPTATTMVCIVGGPTGTTFSSPIDTQSNAWNIAAQNTGNSGAGLQAMALVYTVNTTHALSPSDTFSITNSGAEWRASCFGVAGATGGFDQGSIVLNTNTSALSTSITGSTLAQARELVIAFVVGSNAGSIMPSLVEAFNSYEMFPNQNPIRLGGAWEITAATTAPTASWSWSTNGAATVNALISFKMPYLLQRDLDPTANDNAPAFLNRAA